LPVISESTQSQLLNVHQPPSPPGKRLLILAALLLVAVSTICAYSPVFFNFFSGDDFHSSWLDGTSTAFYRPLISVFMVADYLVWGLNGLGFRFTNLTCHLLSSVLLYFILSKLESSAAKESKPGTSWWALTSSWLFALYPLHPEAVSWITGRVDTIVTTFILASFWSYLNWRQATATMKNSSTGWLVAALFNMALALTSKEMAITLPALFAAYEFFFSRTTFSITPKDLFWRTLRAVKVTSAFWLLLLVYFGVRRLALGTFVGGYDDSLFFIANWQTFVGSWLHGLRMFVIPLNKELLGSHHLMTRAWEILIAASGATAMISGLSKRINRGPFAFLLIWLGLSLLPVYKIFTIAGDLQGSRLAYLATVPLCALLTYGVFHFSHQTKFRKVSLATALGLISAAGIILWINNHAWAHAGAESNAIRTDLSRLYQQQTGDPQVLLLRLPDQVEGAYISRNALWGMLKKPQLERDIYNCLMVNSFEPILPFGYLRNSLAASGKQIQVYAWQSKSRRFIRLNLPNADLKELPQTWHGASLKEVLLPISQGHSQWQSSGALEVKGGSGASGRPAFALKIGSPPAWVVSFVAVKVKILSAGGAGSMVGADLLYANDLDPGFALVKRTHAALKPNQETQSLLFALHNLPEWALGGQVRGLKLLLPENCHLLIESVSIIPSQELMPSVSFTNSGFLGSKGFVHLSSAHPQQELSVRSDNIDGAVATELEITRANLYFESQNTSEASRVRMKTIKVNSANGTFLLKRDLFPAAGIYELRPRALNSRGEIQGVCGNHIVIAVDS
jgi:hypothetical protein